MPHVKVVYESEGEIRRYLLPSGAGAYEELRSKISAVLGPNVSFRVFWKDAEGDTVACDSDLELQTATDAFTASDNPSDVVKLYVRITGRSTPSTATASVAENDAEMQEVEEKKDEASNDAEPNNVHRNVYCDGCHGPIAGIRYKCKKCDEYDLCETCKGKNFHAEHEMDAIPYSAEEGPKVHLGITCDGCGGQVAGIRYKCTQCFNYDLCETCKSKNFHAEHPMEAIPDAEAPFFPFFRPPGGGCHRGRRHFRGGRFPGMQGFGGHHGMWQSMGEGGMGQGMFGGCRRENKQTAKSVDEVARELEAMGIQADGGILRELIEQFHGDITKIIEAMN